MGRFVVGDVISSTFPFSDIDAHKRRPAVVVALADFGDLILCQITSKSYTSTRAIKLTASDYKSGRLPVESYIRPDKLYTASASTVDKIYGQLADPKLQSLLSSLRDLFT